MSTINDGRGAASRAGDGKRDEDDQWSLDRAADLLEGYADHIKSVGADNLQYWPYLPEVEMVAESLRKLAAAPAVSAPAWQPIETAPKDGRDLLLWESGSSVPFVGAWRGGRRPGWYCDTEHYNTDGDACVISNLWQEGVTHWMPLPAAPGFPSPATGDES